MSCLCSFLLVFCVRVWTEVRAGPSNRINHYCNLITAPVRPTIYSDYTARICWATVNNIDSPLHTKSKNVRINIFIVMRNINFMHKAIWTSLQMSLMTCPHILLKVLRFNYLMFNDGSKRMRIPGKGTKSILNTKS